jgi:hypothetical protein
MNNLQADRVVAGRKGECRGNQVLNNIFFACPQRVYLGRSDSNLCNGNVYDAGDQGGLFDIQEPAPRPQPHLDTWQTVFGQDKRSVETAMQAEFDPAKSQLHFSCGTVPETCVPVAPLGEETPTLLPGPFGAEAWNLLRDGKQVVLALPE